MDEENVGRHCLKALLGMEEISFLLSEWVPISVWVSVSF